MRRNTEEMKDALGPNKETKSTKPARVHNKEHGGCRGEWNVLIFKLDVVMSRSEGRFADVGVALSAGTRRVPYVNVVDLISLT